MSTLANSPSRSLGRRLYRSLLRTCKPFTPPSKDAVVLSCLLHRSFIPIEIKETNLQSPRPDSLAKDESSNAHVVLFRNLLREIFSLKSDSKISKAPCYRFPEHVEPTKLREVIQREFKKNESVSSNFDKDVRVELAFLALRKLNEKLFWAEGLMNTNLSSPRPPAAPNVSPLPLTSSKIEAGTYLLAHPHMTGFFRRTVICILKHGSTDNDGNDDDFGSYGLVVNRQCMNDKSGKNLTFREVLSTLPSEIAGAFGDSLVREGGPVHMPSVQMLHSVEGGSNDFEVGGSRLPSINSNDSAKSSKSVYFEGNLVKAAEAVIKGDMEREDVSFFVGASCWYKGQLEREIEQGCWLLCKGPSEIALSGVQSSESDDVGQAEADLWLAMMASCGEEEARLAQLLMTDQTSDYGKACDDF